MTPKSFVDLVRHQTVQVQGRAVQLIDLTIGSILRAVIESTSSVVLWLQSLIFQVLAMTRAATSSGSDLDSWLADYGFTREPAFSATGYVTFSRFTAGNSTSVPVGGKVQTNDGSHTFAVIANASNQYYDAAQAAYAMPIGVSSITVPVISTSSGAAGNVLAGSINVIAQSMPSVDAVSNAFDFVNGSDSESDAAARARFVKYIASLSKATKSAIEYAIESFNPNLGYKLVENFNLDGTFNPGFFYVTIDDGTGAVPAETISNVYAAIDAVRSFTVVFAVFGASTLGVTASVQCTFKTSMTTSDINTAVAQIKSLIASDIDSLKIGETFYYTRLYQLAYEANVGVVNVTNALLNGGTTDVTSKNGQVIKAIHVSVGS